LSLELVAFCQGASSFNFNAKRWCSALYTLSKKLHVIVSKYGSVERTIEQEASLVESV
jgi:hypothetical protein